MSILILDMYKNINKNKLELLKKLCSMIIFHRIKSYSLLFLNFAFSIFWLLAALFPFLHNSNQSTSFQKEKPTKKAPIFGWCFIYLTLFTLILSPSHCFLMSKRSVRSWQKSEVLRHQWGATTSDIQRGLSTLYHIGL